MLVSNAIHQDGHDSLEFTVTVKCEIFVVFIMYVADLLTVFF